MADTLLFRKGSLAGLDSLPIISGAISITTDEPGIYIDHGTERLRIGDFIPVANLDALKDYQNKFGTNNYSKNALYYVEDQNMLVKWTGTEFKLINDQTALSQLVTQLSANLQTVSDKANANRVLIDKIATFDNNGTVTGGALKTETDRAKDAEAALGERIDAITSGTDGTTLASLKKAIEDEVTNRTEAVADVDAKASQAQREVDALEGVVSGVSEDLQEEITRATNKENELAGKIGVNTEGSETGLYKLIKDEKDRAMTAESGLDSKITTAKSDVTTLINNEQTRAEAAEQQIANDLAAEITRAKAREEAISGVANAAQTQANTNAESIADLVAADTTITGLITAEETRAKKAESDLSGRIDGLVTEAATHALKSEVEAVDDKVDALATRVGTTEGDIQNITQQIGLLDQAIDDEVTAREGAITEVKGLISDETSARETAIENEVTARNTAIETAVNAAKATLNESIASNLQKINTNTQAIADEAARAKAAEEANADAITEVSDDLAGEITRATAAEQANADAIAAEKTRAQGAESQLQRHLNSVSATLSEDISDEATTRASEDARILSEAQTYAAGLLEAANAMRYMGTVGDSVTDEDAKRFQTLPTTGVEAGDTYVVVSTDFEIGNKTCKVGDLIVAINDQTGTTYPADLTGWSHVPTGYDASLDQVLSVSDKDANNETITNGAKVALSSVMGSQEKGSLTIVGNTNSNVKASLSGSTLTINMEWEEWT